MRPRVLTRQLTKGSLMKYPEGMVACGTDGRCVAPRYADEQACYVHTPPTMGAECTCAGCNDRMATGAAALAAAPRIHVEKGRDSRIIGEPDF